MNPDSLEKVAEEVKGCPLCKLSSSRKNAVPGEGAVGAKILFIGEAPGRSEDAMGRPFVGSAGKILDNAMASAGIDRSEVFITNLVKCRPPGNREPEEDEIISCRPYLERQIALVEPDIICVLGKTALGALLGGDSIAATRGKMIEKEGRKYFLSLHPAAAIYNRKLLAVIEQDLKKLAAESDRVRFKDSSTKEGAL